VVVGHRLTDGVGLVGDAASGLGTGEDMGETPVSLRLYQVEQREQEDPHQVDEVPVEPDVFGLRREELAAQGLDEQDADGDDPTDDVEPVDAGEHENSRCRRCSSRGRRRCRC